VTAPSPLAARQGRGRNNDGLLSLHDDGATRSVSTNF